MNKRLKTLLLLCKICTEQDKRAIECVSAKFTNLSWAGRLIPALHLWAEFHLSIRLL